MSSDAKIFFMIVATLAMFAGLFCGFLTVVNYFVTGTAVCLALVIYFSFLMLGMATVAGQGNPMRGFRWFTGDGAQRQGYKD